jgi:hypothetical protein
MDLDSPQEAIPPPPKERPGVDLVTPTISLGYTWSAAIDLTLKSLQRGQQIDQFFIAGHGSSGEFTLGQQLTAWRSDSNIAEVQRFRPFTAIWRTNVYIIGCEVAADRPCHHIGGYCIDAFNPKGPYALSGYMLLRKIAEAINAPVHAGTVKLPLTTPWPEQLKDVPRLTVGPDGAWVFRGGRLTGRFVKFGSPFDPPPFVVQVGTSATRPRF